MAGFLAEDEAETIVGMLAASVPRPDKGHLRGTAL
jgi:hypothetical protein